MAKNTKAYDALVNGIGNKATTAVSAIESSYQKEVFDEFVEPTVIYSGDEPVATIGENDSVIFLTLDQIEQEKLLEL